MPQIDMMVRVKKDIYLKLYQKKLEFMELYHSNYTLSEVIEVLILKDNAYGDK